MIITKVELIPVSTPLVKPFIMPGTRITHIHSVVLKLHTDEGIVGYGDSGDTSTWYRGETQESMTAMIANHIAPAFLIGQDPLNIEKIVGQMDTFVRDNNQAKALVDFALHDLKGKALGVPVYQLLGGKNAEASVQGWVASAGPVDQVVAEAVQAHENGFCLIKLKSDGNSDHDVDNVREVRAALGDSARIVVDANGFWNYDQALKTMRRLDRYGMECIEQPVPHWDIEGMARLRTRIDTPIFADESAQELHNIREIIERRAADGLFIKMQKAGGLLKAQRWLTMARLADMAVMSGCMIGSGLEASPSAHLMIANNWASQFTHENLGPLIINNQWENAEQTITQDIALNVPVFSDGKLYPNEGPGFGIELNEEFIATHITEGKQTVTVGELVGV
ncbi:MULTISPECIES: mandelate racemase/muconate lactonizing enzyme family protein [Rhodococcus]|uniref:mandelate racemase/muconate lactonizing enzyme family protein n=1 Tax=Rhodococcus TaxID=1827 RepID=UPI000660710A|nr:MULTISPECIES: enolase C-terminal domain-like protein [Rhodococcus]MDO2380512.1 enolase C-terminal domain-like protein [Rhodococcus ruber]AXY51337.1 mandelate racemase [Rhodococcus ruber]MDO1477112.1 mandelate racemase [Rhodococcus ruber]QRE80462.1 mandelate racemase [Rhodococcus ruber]RQM32886.1 mandelate racemase [Rhodococcus ruber]